MTKFYKATDSNGRIYTRANASEREYSHAILNPKRKPAFAASHHLASNIAGPDDEIAFAIAIDAAEYRALNKSDKPAKAKKTRRCGSPPIAARSVWKSVRPLAGSWTVISP